MRDSPIRMNLDLDAIAEAEQSDWDFVVTLHGRDWPTRPIGLDDMAKMQRIFAAEEAAIRLHQQKQAEATAKQLQHQLAHQHVSRRVGAQSVTIFGGT